MDGKAGSFLIDENLLPQLSFIKEGEFQERSGTPTLKLVGELRKASSVVKTERRDLIKLYPYSWRELWQAVKAAVPDVKSSMVHHIIRETRLKSNVEFSAYNFRNQRQSEEYRKSGRIPGGTPSIYNQAAVEYVAEQAQRLLAGPPNG